MAQSRKKNMTPLCSLALLTILLACCNGTECDDYRTTLPLAEFYTATGGTPQAVTFDSLTIAGIDAPSDSLLADNVRNIQQARLPMRIDSHTNSYALVYATSPKLLADTVTFDCDPEPYFASAACGVVYHYHVKSVTHTSLLLDSVVCLSNPLTNTPLPGIRLYFHTSPEQQP